MAYNRKQRHALTQTGFRHRPMSNWGAGDLPAPWAEGDIVEVQTTAPLLRLSRRVRPGRWVVCYVTSVDEGDAWYVKLTDGHVTSDRLHVIGERSEMGKTHGVQDSMAGVDLVETADPDGLKLRQQMLADGWGARTVECLTCGGAGTVVDYMRDA